MKRSIPVSAALLAAEGSLLFSVPEMTGWQGTPLLLSGGILTILICGTAYFLFSKLAEWKENQNQFDFHLQELNEIMKKMQKSHEIPISEMTELFTSKIGEMQNQFSQNAAHADEVQESAKELYQAGIQQIQKFQQKQSELLTENQKTMISEMTELFTSKIGEMQHQFSQNAAHADEVQKAAKGLYQTGIQQMQETQQKQAECINTAYQKIAVLAEKNTETENQIQRVSENLIEIGETIQSSIEKNAVGIAETFQASMEENAESLHEQQEEYYNNMEEIIEEKLSDYNSAFNKMKDALQSILIEVQHNTEQYQKTLNEILEAQNAMNSLTEQDLRILKGILK